ncbi:hypothetical protein [Rhodoferax ferrireducens]|uniref:hypothetical protein n=1 Tax=Rhodoferax ferrireducens TaxID=192843 RepID=UPI000E0D4A36|nr:hypothetical protein [Rhodoferax ferrireducens]
MTVSELIQILQTQAPEAEVVVPTYNDRSDISNAVGLKLDGERTVSLRAVHINAILFDRNPRAKLYEIDNDGEVKGLEIG